MLAVGFLFAMLLALNTFLIVLHRYQAQRIRNLNRNIDHWLDESTRWRAAAEDEKRRRQELEKDLVYQKQLFTRAEEKLIQLKDAPERLLQAERREINYRERIRVLEERLQEFRGRCDQELAAILNNHEQAPSQP